jgi:hypothetical protein
VQNEHAKPPLHTFWLLEAHPKSCGQGVNVIKGENVIPKGSPIFIILEALKNGPLIVQDILPLLNYDNTFYIYTIK